MSVEIARAPRYNLNVVVRETGIKADTLRAWEKRYGLPRPVRTVGGHRLYSQHDIDTVKWLKKQQRKKGLRISKAVNLWRGIEESGQDPLSIYGSGRTTLSISPALSDEGHSLTSMRTSWINACLAFDEPEAERILSQSFAYYSPETVSTEILIQGLEIIGNLWYQGNASVQQEHFATQLTIRRLYTMITASPHPIRSGKILIACPPREDHAVPSLLLTLLLRHRGWEVVHLGTDVPKEQFEAAIAAIRPDLVVLTATRLETAATLRDIALALKKCKTTLAFGGRIFNQAPDLTRRIPGHFLGQDLIAAIPEVERLLQGPPQQPDHTAVSTSARLLASSFERVKPTLDSRILTWAAEELDHENTLEHVEYANDHMTRDLSAALALGEINSLETTIHWLAGLLANRGAPGDLFENYLTTYRDTVDTLLGNHGGPIVDWLSHLPHNLKKVGSRDASNY